MVDRALHDADFAGQIRPQCLQILGSVVAVGDQMIGSAHAAGHDDIQMVLQRWHRRIGIMHEGEVVNGQQFPAGGDRRQDEVGRVKEIDRAAGEPFDAGKRDV